MLALRYALPTIYRFPPITRVSQMRHRDQNDAPTPPHSHGSERRIIDLPQRGFLPRMFERVGIHYGWAVTGVVFLTMLSTSAAMGMVGVLMLPLKTEFGWDLGAGVMGYFSNNVGLRFDYRYFRNFQETT